MKFITEENYKNLLRSNETINIQKIINNGWEIPPGHFARNYQELFYSYNYAKTKECRIKIETTMFKKYGVRHMSHLPER